MRDPLSDRSDRPRTDLADPARLALIVELGLHGQLGDVDLDAIVATVADACDVPIAVINVVTPALQTYPAAHGLGLACTTLPDRLSFCAEVVETGTSLFVPDARLHPVYAQNPYVLSGEVVAFAGEPLVHEGQVIGSLSVFDSRPRQFTVPERRVLKGQARVVGAVLRLRSRTLSVLAAAQVEAAAVDAAELRRAVSEGQLVLHYHPLMELGTDRMVGVEALVRWQHPTRGLLPPSAFIPLAEESGVIVELGEWVLRTAALQAARWCSAGQPLDVAINLSPRQLASRGFARHAIKTLTDTGAPADRLVLEVTESALMDQQHATETLERLRDHGVRLALDDFGTGYSSFAYLRRFPIDTLKIDRSFVAGLGKHTDDEAIVTSVVGLARNTGKTVVAEGVETARQAALLRALGVQFGQGFWWSKPLPAELVVPWSAGRGGSAQHGAEAPAADVALQHEDPRAVIMGMHDAGASLHTIAAALNAQGRRTGAGSRWHVRSVREVVSPPVGLPLVGVPLLRRR